MTQLTIRSRHPVPTSTTPLLLKNVSANSTFSLVKSLLLSNASLRARRSTITFCESPFLPSTPPTPCCHIANSKNFTCFKKNRFLHLDNRPEFKNYFLLFKKIHDLQQLPNKKSRFNHKHRPLGF